MGQYRGNDRGRRRRLSESEGGDDDGGRQCLESGSTVEETGQEKMKGEERKEKIKGGHLDYQIKIRQVQHTGSDY